MSNNTLNEKTFTVVLNRIKTYSLKMYGFAITTAIALLLHISRVSISINIKQRIKDTLTMRVSKISASLVSHLQQRSVVTNRIKRIVISLVLKTINRMIVNPLIRLRIASTARRLLRMGLLLSTKKLVVAITATVAVLYKLSDFDSQLLSALDGLTLGAMDHT